MHSVRFRKSLKYLSDGQTIVVGQYSYAVENSIFTCPDLQSGSLVHSGPQPVIVSGLGMSPASHWHSALPAEFTEHLKQKKVNDPKQISRLWRNLLLFSAGTGVIDPLYMCNSLNLI